MKELIEYMARAIVDYPDQVVVTEEMEDDRIVYHLAAIRRGARAVLEIG
jgi:predicted RNA-binding protein YlqC (UPF0109 family)